jgi:hypothetical protein
MKSIDSLLIKHLDLDLTDENNQEFFEQVKKCVFLENDSLLFKFSIYRNINWGKDDVEIFDYTIKLLKENNIFLCKKLFTFIGDLENIDRRVWEKFYRGYEFYPLLLFYMITLENCDQLNFDDHNVFTNFFNLEPDNVDWSYFDEYLDMQYLNQDLGNMHAILDVIFNALTIRNTSSISMLKSVLKNVYIKIDEDNDHDSISYEIKLFDDLKEKIKNLELKL